MAAAGAGGADDNHATALAAVLVGGHVDFLVWCVWGDVFEQLQSGEL